MDNETKKIHTIFRNVRHELPPNGQGHPDFDFDFRIGHTLAYVYTFPAF